MRTQEIAAAMQRVEAVLQRRPEAGLHDDAPAAARWTHGTRVVTSHANGVQLPTDMPTELGGSGDQVTPGWLFRAGIASCAATTVALAAARADVQLSLLEVRTGSRSDARGLLGLPEADGTPVCAGPVEVQLDVRIAAPGMAPERLRALVEDALKRSPMPNALVRPTPMALRIEVDGES